MISPRSFLLCTLATLIGSSFALPSTHNDEPSIGHASQYSCSNNAIITDKLEPNPFFERYCLKGLCVATNDAVLTHVESKGCGVYANVCSEKRDQVKIGNETFISTGYGQCTPVKNSVLTFTCPNGDELLWHVKEDMTSSFSHGNIVKQAPLAYYESTRKEVQSGGSCVKPKTKGKSKFAIDNLQILCDSDNAHLCVA